MSKRFCKPHARGGLRFPSGRLRSFENLGSCQALLHRGPRGRCLWSNCPGTPLPALCPPRNQLGAEGICCRPETHGRPPGQSGWQRGGWEAPSRQQAERLRPDVVGPACPGAGLCGRSCRRRGRSAAAESLRAQAVPASGASHASNRSHRPGPRGRMSESKRRGRGRDPKHREGRKRERKQELLPGEEGRALPRRAQTPRFPGRNLPPAHPPPAPRG